MRKINFIRHILPHLVAIAAFLLITLVFFNPIFFDKKVLSQDDITMWHGSAKTLLDFREKTGDEGLWAPNMFSGMPGYLVNVNWSNDPVIVLKKILGVGLPHPIINIFLAFVSYYILLLSFGVRPYLAIGGAVAFGLSSYMIVGLAAGHNSRIGAIAFMPLVMAGIHLTFSRQRILGFAVTTLGLALQLRENHLQITYYLLIIVAVYGLVQLIYALREKTALDFGKNLVILLPAVVIAAGTFFGPFWAITEYSRHSIRGPSELVSESNQPADTISTEGLSKDYAFQYSNGIFEPMTLLIPNILGGSSAQSVLNDPQSHVYQELERSGNLQMANQLARYTVGYWGSQPGTIPYYAGAVICCLFALGIAFAERKYIWWLVPVSILSIILSWGDNFKAFNYFLFDYLPGYNKFRSVTFALVIILFAMPLLGFLGLEKIVSKGWKKNEFKKLWGPIAVIAGICLLLIVTGGFGNFMRPFEADYPDWFPLQSLRKDRMALLRGDAWRSFWFILIFSGLLFARIKEWVKGPVFALVTGLLITFDLSFVDKRYFGEENYRRKRGTTTFPLTEADKKILSDTSYYRVYNPMNPWNEAFTSYHHNSIGGYHGAKIRRYQDLYDSCLSGEMAIMNNNEVKRNADSIQHYYGVMNMLNVKYILAGPNASDVVVNPFHNGNAWFVSEVEEVNSPIEELKAVCNVNTRQTAVVDASAFEIPNVSYDSSASIQLVAHQPNYLTYRSRSNVQGLAVFSEIYYPHGWEATIDGNPASLIRANYVLRALAIPAGNHTIELRFEPKAYAVGNKITMASSWLMILIVLGCIGWSLKETKNQNSGNKD